MSAQMLAAASKEIEVTGITTSVMSSITLVCLTLVCPNLCLSDLFCLTSTLVCLNLCLSNLGVRSD